MRISEITIENFRSIKFAKIPLTEFSIFVGQNNHGKTNVFEAIEWFYSAKSSPEEYHFEKDTNSTIVVEVHYVDVVPNDIAKLSSETNQTKIRTLLSDSNEFAIRKTSVDHKRVYLVNGEQRPNPQGIDTAINEFLPRLEYVSTRIRLEDVSTYKEKNPIGQMLSAVLTAIIDESHEYREFKSKFSDLFENDESQVRVKLNELGESVGAFLRKQFPGESSVRFTVIPPEFSDLLKSFETKVDDGVITAAEDKGDGMQRAIMLSIMQAFSEFRKSQADGSTFLFLIDEAELHLHPSAQRLLKTALLEICLTDQVMINTHSSVLVVDDHSMQRLFRVEKEGHETKISTVKGVEKIDVVFDLLGGTPQDLLLPRNFLIVEGRSEFELLSRIIGNFYENEFEGIKIIYSGGDTERQQQSIDAINFVLQPLVGVNNSIYKERLVLVLDQPNQTQQAQYARFKANYAYLFDSDRVFVLPTGSLEEYYPSPWTKSQAQLAAMSRDRKAKTDLAREVASGISKIDFELKLSILFEALQRCNDMAF